MAKGNKSAEVTVKFRSPSFIHKGKKYISKDIEAAAQEGDEDAMRIIAELVQKQSSIVSVEETPVEKPKGKPKGENDPNGSEGGNDD